MPGRRPGRPPANGGATVGDPFKVERAEYRRLYDQLNVQARGIADRLLARGPSAVNHLGPQVKRYEATKREIDALMLRVTGSSRPEQWPDW